MEIFTTGTKNRWSDLVYADFFSGPGLNMDEGGGESPGSPLRASRFPLFSRLFLSDADPAAISALRTRLGRAQLVRTKAEVLDCNDAVDAARVFLFPGGSGSATLGLAFIDPTAFQMSFESLSRLVRGVRLDLIITFMTSYVRRFIGQTGFGEGSDIDLFMGTRDWLNLRRNSPTFTRDLLDIYALQLRSLGYGYVDDDTRILIDKRSTIYHLVFASRHERGKEFFAKISQRSYGGVRRLPGALIAL